MMHCFSPTISIKSVFTCVCHFIHKDRCKEMVFESIPWQENTFTKTYLGFPLALPKFHILFLLLPVCEKEDL